MGKAGRDSIVLSGQIAMHCNVYLRKGRIFLPTILTIRGGPYVVSEPVESFSTDEIEQFRSTLESRIVSRNSLAPPGTKAFNKILLRYLKVRSYSQLERETRVWGISDDSGEWEIYRYRRRHDRGLERDQATIRRLSNTTEPHVLAAAFVDAVSSDLR
jgi:hypothetical protein